MKRTLLGLMVAAVALSANAADDTMKTGFKDLDANGDGKLSSAEVSSQTMLSNDFKTLDTDGDGFVSETEYASWSAKSPAPADTEPKPTTNP
jgi:Ca2+-binding EF-hand superfamily protein